MLSGLIPNAHSAHRWLAQWFACRNATPIWGRHAPNLIVRPQLLGASLSLCVILFIDLFGSSNLALAKGVVDFQRDVIPILEARCVGCHSGEKAKAGFIVSNKEAVLGFVEPGNSSASPVWTDYLTAAPMAEDPKSLVMPPSGPLPARELAVLKLWIDEGAVWPDDSKFSTAGAASNAPVTDGGQDASLLNRSWGALGYFHPAIVHFPIALLIFGGAAAGLSFFTGNRAQTIAFYCLVWGCIATLVAVAMGWSFATEKGYPSWEIVPDAATSADTQLLFRHRWMGVVVASLSVVTLLFAMLSKKFPSHSIRHIWRLGMLVLALLVSIVGHQGGELVYGDILAKAMTRLVGK